MARIAFHLRHPVANRLGRRLELLREIVRTTPCSHQLHHSTPVFRRIPCMTLGHRGSPSLSPLRHCPRNRVNSIPACLASLLFALFLIGGSFPTSGTVLLARPILRPAREPLLPIQISTFRGTSPAPTAL